MASEQEPAAAHDAGAADATHSEVGAGDGHGGGHGGGMPQLNVHEFAPQIVWLVITFVALYMVMSRIAMPRLASAVGEREETIRDDLAQADAFRNQAEDARAAYEKALADARADAQKIAAETRAEIHADIESETTKIEAAADKKLAAAEAEVAKARKAAVDAIPGIAADAAQSLVAAVLGTTPDRGKTEAAVKAVIA